MATNLNSNARTPGMHLGNIRNINRLWLVAFLVGCITTLLDWAVATLATPIVYAPADYPSFSLLPLFAGCMLGALGGCAVLLRLDRKTQRPVRNFYRIAAIVLLVSYTLPVLPIVNPLPRFAGVNWGIAITLMGMHTLTAVIITQTLVTAYKFGLRRKAQVEVQS